METETIIGIETKKFRSFFETLCKEYGSDLIIIIDGKEYTQNDYKWLISTWCSRQHLINTINFSVKKDNELIFWFHDSPENLCADSSQLNFIAKLHEQGIVKYEVIEYTKPKGILQKLLRIFQSPKPIKRYRG